MTMFELAFVVNAMARLIAALSSLITTMRRRRRD
jgi:hypothetical protein